MYFLAISLLSAMICSKKSIILSERERTPFDFEEIWIDGDDALEDAHGLRVPVIEIDGEEEFVTFVDPHRFAYLVGARPS